MRGADGETLDGRRDGGDGGTDGDDGNGIVRAIEPKRVARSFVRSIHSFIHSSEELVSFHEGRYPKRCDAGDDDDEGAGKGCGTNVDVGETV